MFRLQDRMALISDVRNRTLTLIEREDDTRS
jgi:DNA-binding XRE family transcriptional regulator